MLNKDGCDSLEGLQITIGEMLDFNVSKSLREGNATKNSSCGSVSVGFPITMMITGMVLMLRMISNQILDPWVYLLLREILFRKFCIVANAVSNCSIEERKETQSALDALNKQKQDSINLHKCS
ncbi:uncharacterized protein ptger3 isoform X2 [Cebidichthys violaceus]|uniref:uncharacterized protein ptger3 isoform X2 n=1 Tax=Cebidichthys violaceus TaxID=271503 RepID=UPI0035C9E0F3